MITYEETVQAVVKLLVENERLAARVKELEAQAASKKDKDAK